MSGYHSKVNFFNESLKIGLVYTLDVPDKCLSMSRLYVILSVGSGSKTLLNIKQQLVYSHAIAVILTHPSLA